MTALAKRALPPLAAALLTDIRLQLRYGFYYIYLFICLSYVAVLYLLPSAVSDLLLPVLIFSDPAVAGYLFIGALIMLEKGDGTLAALFVTPITVATYVLGKVLSLTALATASGLLIAVAYQGLHMGLPLVALGIALSAMVFVPIGMAVASRFKVLNRFMVVAGSAMALFCLPLVEFFGLVDSPLFWLLPTKSAMVLIGAGCSGRCPPPGEFALALVLLLGWSIAAQLWARRWLQRYVVQQQGVQ